MAPGVRQWRQVIVATGTLAASITVLGDGLERCHIPLVQSAEQAPVIDGILKGGEWTYALKTAGLVSNEGAFAQRPATIYYLADGDSLYVGMHAPAVPTGTVPEVKDGPAYDGRKYTDFGGNDRIEVKFSPPAKDAVGQFYLVADAAGHRYVEQIKGEHLAISPEWEYKTSYDENGWTAEMRLPARLFQQQGFRDGDSWGFNFTLARLFPLKYEGLVKGPHSLGQATLAAGGPAVQIERLGELFNGRLDLAVTVREYEGLVATPKEGAYDERAVVSGGLALKKSGKAARVSWELTCGGKTVEEGHKILELIPAQKLAVEVTREFTPAAANELKLTVELAASAAAFDDPAAALTVLYSASVPFVPFNVEEAAAWKERLEKGTVIGSWRFNPAYFPYWEKAKVQAVFFKGKVLDQAARLRVTIRSDRGFAAVREVPVTAGRMVVDSPDRLLDIPIPGLPEGVYTAVGEVLDAEGRVASSQTKTYVRTVYAWEHNTLGKSRGVIKPWTPMSVNGSTVSCWARDLVLDGSGLPTGIHARDKGVLAAPVTITLKGADGVVKAWTTADRPVFTETAEDRVQWTGAATIGDEIHVAVKGLAEYDGFTWYEVTLTPKQAVPIQSGQIDIALPGGQAQLMHFQSCWARNNFSGAIPSGAGVVFRSLDTVNYGRKGGFSPHVWLGNLTRGLSWFADSDEGWSSAADRSALEVVRDGATVRLVMNIIARPVTLEAPRTLRFGLMATPLKPPLPIEDIQTRAVNWLSFKDNKTVVQANMYGVYPPGFDYKLIDEHVPGRRLYFNKHEMGAAMPERAVFDNEWGGMEPAPDYPGAPERFGPGIESRTVNRALTDSRIDMLVYYIAEMARKTSMAATYWDITGIGGGLPMLENGTAYVDPETNSVVPTFDILKSRQLFKRVATMWQEVRGEPDRMEIHSTNHMGVPFYSFAYCWLNFEWLWPNEKARRPDGQWQDFMDLRPLDLFATEGGPTQFGVWIGSINGGQRPDDPAEHRRVSRSGTALALLHNHGHGGMGCAQLNTPPTIGRRDDLAFVGYWDEDAAARADQALVRASYWHSDGQLELALVNLGLEPVVTTVAVPFAKIGWKDCGRVEDTTREPELAAMRGLQRYKTSPEWLARMDELEKAAAASRTIVTSRKADGVLYLTLPLASHDYRVLTVEGR